MPFGQLVIGPPGSGKTTYCNGMYQFLSGLERKVAIVNLDPANDSLPYPCAVDITELVSLEDVVQETELGPNGGLVYCIEYLEKNLDWLQERLETLQDHYILFDCPGQVELYTHNQSMQHIVDKLQKWTYRITAVHLVDSYYCSSASSFVSVLLLSLSTMLRLELPHINVLSKIDLIENYGKLDFNLDFYTDVLDLSYLHQFLDENTPSATSEKFARLNKKICELVEDYSLVNFIPLNIQDKESMYNLVKAIDKSNGYIFGGLTRGNESIMSIAQGETDWDYNKSSAVQEKYFNPEEDNAYDLEDDDEEAYDEGTEIKAGTRFNFDLDDIDED